jgi:hypothetical protein
LNRDKFTKENEMSEKFIDEHIYPINMSTSGANAFYLDECNVSGCRPNYAVCLNRIEQIKSDQLKGHDCEAEIQRKTCPAAKMREEELVVGKAIYFIDRAKLQAFTEANAGKASVGHGRRGSIAPAKPSAVESDVMTSAAQFEGDYAAAINLAMVEASPAKLAEPGMSEKHHALVRAVDEGYLARTQVAKAGMSLVELARLHLATKAV